MLPRLSGKRAHRRKIDPASRALVRGFLQTSSDGRPDSAARPSAPSGNLVIQWKGFLLKPATPNTSVSRRREEGGRGPAASTRWPASLKVLVDTTTWRSSRRRCDGSLWFQARSICCSSTPHTRPHRWWRSGLRKDHAGVASSVHLARKSSKSASDGTSPIGWATRSDS